MKILSVVAFAAFLIAASHTPVQAGEKLPFFQMSDFEKGTPVQMEIVPTSSQEDGVESVVIQCGVPPGGQYVVCIRTEYEDGSDCLAVFPNEGDPEFFDCDSASW